MPKIEESYVEVGRRHRMVDELREKGITDQDVLEAMRTVPRHLFMDTVLMHRAYEDHAFPIVCGQTISRPSTVAFQTQLLSAQKGMKILEIGTGSGYQTAVLCSMGLEVYTIERHKDLYDNTKRLLTKLRYRVNCFLGDGFVGLPQYGPFDRVLITCGAPFIPMALVRQMKKGGIMVLPVQIDKEKTEMLKITKTGEGEKDYTEERFGHFRFVPMLQEISYNRN